VNRAIAEAAGDSLELSKVSRQKKDALFELAARIGILAEQLRASPAALARAASAEKRKPLRVGLELLAVGSAVPGSLDRGFAASIPRPRTDPGAELEWMLVRAGIRGIADDEHYSVIMRRMTAFLGPEFFAKTEAWLLERVKRRKSRPESLVVPGELPDVIRILAMDKRNLERALHASGRDIAAAALAGCPQESMDLARPLYGKIGAAALEDDAARLRSRLSGDEISQAQATFLEVVRSLEERGEFMLGAEDELSAEPEFVAALTKAVLGLDSSLIRGAFRSVQGVLIATAMQGMQPSAHDRILEALSKKEIKRILDAIDDSDPLPRRAVQGAGKELAGRLFEAAAAAKAPRAALERLAVIRDWGE
jgi:hypothetical protein